MKLTNEYVRPSVSVSFFQRSAEVEAYINTNYVDTNKLNSTTSYSPDGLTRTYVINFLDQPTFEDYIDDPVIVQETVERKTYNKQNLILHTLTLREYD